MPAAPARHPDGIGSRSACGVVTLAAAGVFTLSGPAQAQAMAASATATPALAEQVARAIAYEHGEGLPKDQPVAAALYCEAASAGSAEAAFRLGWMYANGRGVPRDDGTAAALFRMASDRGDAYARTTLERMGQTNGTLPRLHAAARSAGSPAGGRRCRWWSGCRFGPRPVRRPSALQAEDRRTRLSRRSRTSGPWTQALSTRSSSTSGCPG